jgi:hypothetical protein
VNRSFQTFAKSDKCLRGCDVRRQIVPYTRSSDSKGTVANGGSSGRPARPMQLSKRSAGDVGTPNRPHAVSLAQGTEGPYHADSDKLGR